MAILEDALKRQPRLNRYLCHLRQRLSQKRLNLVTGAGISIDAGVPSWTGLLDRLAEKPKELATDFAAHKSRGLHPEYLGQILFHRHRDALAHGVAVDIREATVNQGWATAIHEAIYRDVSEDISSVLVKHPFLKPLRDLAREVSLVINFNFDDLLADALGDGLLPGAGVNSRPFTVAWRPPLVDRPNTTTVYHVNGILPHAALRKRSPELIFTEDSFANAIARSPGVGAEYILLRFVQNTMLVVGHSLNDNSLKGHLRKNRDKSPANHHYMVYWVPAGDALEDKQRQDNFDANLELYNVITIFLTSSEMAEFFSLLTLDERAFGDFMDGFSKEPSQFHYYIVGPVASGKSSLLEQLRSFDTFEEWTRPPPNEMYYAHDKIDPDKRQKVVDAFVYSELKEKNRRMTEAGVGFHFMDRAPLDLYAFSKSDDENKSKTAQLKALVTRDRELKAGEIVFITARPETLVRRNLGRGRLPADAGDEAYLEKQDLNLQSVYAPVTPWSTDDCNAGELAKRIARHALMEDYAPVDLKGILGRYE